LTSGPARTGRRRSWENRALDAVRSVCQPFARSRSVLVVGVSGGPDSVCLLHLLAKSRELLCVSLHAAHLDHGLRGADSEADREYVVGLCRLLEVPVRAEKTDLFPLRRKHSPLEEVAREARYSFFARVAGDVGSDVVAVGHTADDQLETVLMHLVRGTGTRGLAGMDTVTSWREEGGLRIVRPLLGVRRSETEEYCTRFDLKPRTDKTNVLPVYLRNRVRMELLPLLRELNPGFDGLLLRTAAIARDDFRSLEIGASELWPQVARTQGDALRLDSERLTGCPPGLRRLLLLRAIEQVSGGRRDIDAQNVEALMGALLMPPGKNVELSKGIVAHTSYGEVVLGNTPPSPFPVIPEEYPLNIPGETRKPGWEICASVVQPCDDMSAHVQDSFSACIDLQSAGKDLTVRMRRNGDRFQPLGMSVTKKLQDFMVDARIPRDWRDGVPLVCSGERIVWVVGWRIDDRVKVTWSTREALVLQFRRVQQAI